MEKNPYIGQRVVIADDTYGRYRFYMHLIGARGDVVRAKFDAKNQQKLFGVRVDNEVNKCDEQGLFYYPAMDLEPEHKFDSPVMNCRCSLPNTRYGDKLFSRDYLARPLSKPLWVLDPEEDYEEDTENKKEEYNMLPGYKTASIQFLEGVNKEKTYFYALYDDTIQAGDLVVVSTGHHGLALARVAFIGGPASYVSCDREIVCKVDTSAWDARKEKAVKLQQLKEDMDERVKAYQATALYELAAEKDPALKAMLDQFKALQEG